MKILLIDHAKKNFREQDTGRWHFLPYYFEKAGHEVLHLTKEDWRKFYATQKEFDPDFIISTGFAGMIPIIYKKLGLIKQPLIHDWNDYYDEIFSARLGRLAAFLERYVIKNSNYVTSPSKYLLHKGKTFGKKVEFIQHGVELNLTVKKANLKGKFKILYIGELTPYKRVDRIIESVKGLNCELYLIGHPTEELKKIAGGNTHFIGRVPHEKIAGYLKAADVCVVTADQENLKLWEYAKAGKAVLAYKGRNRISYFLTHNKTAYITNDLREGLLRLMKDKKLKRKLEKNIKTLPFYPWKGIAKKYLDFLLSIK